MIIGISFHLPAWISNLLYEKKAYQIYRSIISHPQTSQVFQACLEQVYKSYTSTLCMRYSYCCWLDAGMYQTGQYKSGIVY